MAYQELYTPFIESPNHSGQRNHEIDTITIHSMAGQLTAEACGGWFSQEASQSSSHYGVGRDGSVAQYVKERNRPWTTSSASNDNRAITIEVASDPSEPYRVTDEAYETLIDLLVDICYRHQDGPLKYLKWQADEDLIGEVDKQNMTVHRWFANKSCPGNYLYGKHYDIVKRVNTRLEELYNEEYESTTEETKDTETNTSTKSVQNGSTFKVGVDNIHIYSEPSYESKDYGLCPRGTYTIIEKKNGFGKLKSGAGWIPIYTDVKDIKVRVTSNMLRIRRGPGIDTVFTGNYVPPGIYTIVEIKNNFGKLKSGAGWISMDYTERI